MNHGVLGTHILVAPALTTDASNTRHVNRANTGRRSTTRPESAAGTSHGPCSWSPLPVLVLRADEQQGDRVRAQRLVVDDTGAAALALTSRRPPHLAQTVRPQHYDTGIRPKQKLRRRLLRWRQHRRDPLGVDRCLNDMEHTSRYANGVVVASRLPPTSRRNETAPNDI
jgi:hypothetical protein